MKKWRTIQLLQKIKLGKIELVLASRKLRQLYLEQEEEIKRPFLSIELAIGYESVLDNCPIESEYSQWNAEALKKQLESVELYRDRILKDVDNPCFRMLNALLNDLTISTSYIATINSKSPDERYKDLLFKHPQWINRFPQMLIASYLGMTPETLSRVRARIK